MCLFCNTKNGIMFPVFFESKSIGIKFEAAVMTYQLYHQYFNNFEKIYEKKALSNRTNIKLLQSLGEQYSTC
jgi:hypothetical protein